MSISSRNAWIISAGACIALAGCGRAPAEPGQAAGGPPPVTVAEPIQREVTDYADYPGRTAAVDSLEVRARVSGYLQKIEFKDGADVKAGQVLYVIDPRPYQAVYDQAVAQERLQEANLKYQQAVYNRDLALLGTSAISQEELQQARSQRDTAAAQVNAAKAAVEQARLNLSFTNVTTAISGRLSRTLITLGNLVVADTTLLTTIVSQDPMYAYFDVDEATMLRVSELVRAGKFPSTRTGARIPIHLALSTEHGFPHEGYVDFANNQVTPSTGTLQVRGMFANPAPKTGPRLLFPGLFVRIRVPVSVAYKALLVVERAIGTDQNFKFVLTVDEQNKVVRHNVVLGTEQDGLRVILKGLQPGERVIIDGLQHAMPGQMVQPTVVAMSAAITETEPTTPPMVTNPPPAAPQTKR